MQNNEQLEVWLRGPLPEIPDLLQPVAHALLQAREELGIFTNTFPSKLLWEKPANVASVGFHLQHLAGVLDRLFTYAREESLSESQMVFLKTEGQEPMEDCTYNHLLDQFSSQLERALKQLRETNPDTLTEIRYVGRAMVPSTHLGLLFHAAEHTQRHVGQMLVTAKVLITNHSS
ncbi:DinB family protein [Dyadobacter jiangsuensis]|uniref:DinB family protein n=1 Tax=Dyadobacter jiangsuensis TaxID=1591085 RepID=A0A2P8G8A3_9BACT|nr:DinB family protein [Dyadobacter jiangsuensis]PSL30204.1 DinB family protein [Dyadobacter jiangsuensis]